MAALRSGFIGVYIDGTLRDYTAGKWSVIRISKYEICAATKNNVKKEETKMTSAAEAAVTRLMMESGDDGGGGSGYGNGGGGGMEVRATPFLTLSSTSALSFLS